jgi:hypothetical protein
MRKFTAAGRPRWAAAAALILGITLVPSLAVASHPEASLTPSNFEIDENANLKLDDAAPSVDWGSLTHPNGPEQRATDAATGTNDDSYSGGVKEDTTCPNTTTGSIPNNKSDLLTFHVYEEPGIGDHPGFLNLAWSRVSDPSGTTLMDFEFNQSSTSCAQGFNKIRTAGDLLIEYAIDQGGARANVSGRIWTGTAWGPSQDLDSPSAACDGDPCAVGTINQTSIPATEADGLGLKQARTFGEAQIDLRLIFDDDECASFGSAMLKSRSSDAFTSQLKDFIKPVAIDLQNCARVVIRKQTDPDEDPNTTDFGYTKSFPTDPTSADTFTLKDDGVKDYGDTVLFGTGYTVTEDVVGAGYDFNSINCSASQNVTPSINGATITFDIDSDADVLDCTYTNRARGSLIIEKVTTSRFGAFDFTSSTLDPASWTLTTTAAGAAGKASRTFSDLAPGTYDAAETVPTGWNLTSATCSDGSAVTAIGVSGGETVTCTFTNAPETGAIKIVKTRKHAASGPGDHPHAGVTFTVSGGSLPAGGQNVVTLADGTVCLDGLVVSSLAGNYSVLEQVPAGYTALSTNPQGGLAVTEGTCGGGNERTVTFENMPLTNITVSVDSQVNGGTASTIDCHLTTPGTDASTAANGDGSYTMNDLVPGTYTCEVFVDP